MSTEQKLRVGQIRRWNITHVQGVPMKEHSANGLLFRVASIDGTKPDGCAPTPFDADNGCFGRYLRPGEHPEAKNDPGYSRWTQTNPVFMLEQSELVEEDASHYLTVNVSRKDIDEGTCENPFTCAVAHAIKRAAVKRWRRWENLQAVVVCDGRIKRDVKDKSGNIFTTETFAFTLPKAATDFVTLFDTTEEKDRKNLQPFTFKVEIPEEFVGRQRSTQPR